MKDNKKKKKKTQKEINEEAFNAGVGIIKSHKLFGRIYVGIYADDKAGMNTNTYCYVNSNGRIYGNKNIYLSPKEWAFVFAHAILHLCFGHFDAERMPHYKVTLPDGKIENKLNCDIEIWNMACDIYVTKFLYDIKFPGAVHDDPSGRFPGGLTSETAIYDYLMDNETKYSSNKYSTAADGKMDMHGLANPIVYDGKGWGRHHNTYMTQFAAALANSVTEAISIAGGREESDSHRKTRGEKAAEWFINSYPLLGGLAAHFKIVESISFCQDNDIHVAAISPDYAEIYLNPYTHLTDEELKFVLAHEYLHAGLQHRERRQGRDVYLWNIACDFVINGWLKDMQIGKMPEDGLMYDENLKDMSAEAIYDIIIRDIRKYSKYDTFRGNGKSDIFGDDYADGKGSGHTTLDDFCKHALQNGLAYHQSTGRGFVPAGLIEEIRALSMPPIPWDVKLANWFDVYFAPLEKHRTYARPSRRQSSTPDIPRPSYVPLDVKTDSRTFGVVIDTSGSMSASTIGKALGSIASYSVAHDVPFARVVFCDAAAYDAGYISPEDIAGRVEVKGRGGTELQPGVDLLEKAKDFPKDGPILIITDGYIEDHIEIKHDHAWLMPAKGRGLPFKTKAEIFRFPE